MDNRSLELIIWFKENFAHLKLNKYKSSNIIKVSSGTIAKNLRCSPRKASLVLEKLEKEGYIKVLERRPRNTRCGKRTIYIIKVIEWNSH